MRTIEQTLKLVKEIYLSVLNNDIEYDKLNLFSELDNTIFYHYSLEESGGQNDLYSIIDSIDGHGGEGEGEEYWTISELTIKETGEKIYVKFYGYYSSWEGVEWQGIEIVEPREVMVTQYFNIY